MRIGVLGSYQSASAYQQPSLCPSGYQIDETSQICLPTGAVVTVGGGNANVPPCLTGSGPLQPGQQYCPAPLPKDSPPSQGYCPPGTGLFQNSVCIPLTSPQWNQVPVTTDKTIIPGVPDWALYATVGVLAIAMLKGSMGR